MVMGRGGAGIISVIWLLLMMAPSAFRSSVAQHQFNLVHQYAHMHGSSARQGEQGISEEYYTALVQHDQRRLRRMLPEVVSFPLTGDDNIYITGLYYTRISLGTPPQQFYVQVDTGSDVVWVNCVPCTSCKRTGNAALPVSIYDPQKSSTAKSISCSDPQCSIASSPVTPQCSTNSLQCPYSTLYGDGSTTKGYFVDDTFTFNTVPSGNSSATSGQATLTFGCGSNQTGLWSTDGLIGFGQAAISAPSQLTEQGKTQNIFAHCLQGDDLGSGSLVIGTIREPGLVYTPIVPQQDHYNVKLENIAVSGTNVTSAAAFDLTTTGGVIFDSGTTLTYLVTAAYTKFEAGVINAAPVAPREISDSQGNTQTCFIYSGSLGNFPNLTLYFAGGAAMTLGPKNYLYKEALTSGSTAYCFSWIESTASPGSKSYTIFGDNVLKDKLVVYDNVNKQIGWKNFDCTKGIAVSSTPSSPPVTVLPTPAGPAGASPGSSSAHRSKPARLFSLGLCVAALVCHCFL